MTVQDLATMKMAVEKTQYLHICRVRDLECRLRVEKTVCAAFAGFWCFWFGFRSLEILKCFGREDIPNPVSRSY